MSALDQATIDALKAKYPGELRKLTVDEDVLVVRGPSRAEFKRFSDRAVNEKARNAAVEELAYTCVVHPDRAALDVILDRKYGTVARVANLAMELGGLTADEEAEKLLRPCDAPMRTMASLLMPFSLCAGVTRATKLALARF